MTTSNSSVVLGVDSGGTFTDLVAIDEVSGEVTISKVPSTPQRPAEAVMSVLADTGGGHNMDRLVHGTTVATNAVLERKGATVCLLTTAGIEDVPFIQRINRKYAFDLNWKKPTPLVRRRHVLGVGGRVGSDGTIVESLDEAEVRRVIGLVRSLMSTTTIEAFAIALLFSYMNDEHETRLAGAIHEAFPDIPVALSSEVSPVWREYERVSTTLTDAFVRPALNAYLRELDETLETKTRDNHLLLLKSNGGIGRPASVATRPVTLLLSGLAGGAVAGAYFARQCGLEKCISLDMGGTSTDVALIEHGDVRQVREVELEWGLPVVTPSVDVTTIGAGGGSIASVDTGGLLRVGPESAGAMPGPAAYGLGGTRATVTDANIVAGRLNPDFFLAGTMQLSAPAAHVALSNLAASAGLELAAATLAVLKIANENMANAVRLLTIDRGIDPRSFALVAFGGAGPAHACDIAASLGMTSVLVPAHPGVASAFGAAVAGLKTDREWSIGRRVHEGLEDLVRSQFDRAIVEAERELKADGARGPLLITMSVALRYYLQNYEHDVPVASLAPRFLSDAIGAFHDLHRHAYGYAFSQDPVELVGCKLTLVERPLREPTPHFSYSAAQSKGKRLVLADDGHWSEAEILHRGHLGACLPGPLIVEEPHSTTYVPEGWKVANGLSNSLILSRESA